MFSYHPMTLIRAFLLMFVAAEIIMIAALLIRGIASLTPAAMQGATFVCAFLSGILRL